MTKYYCPAENCGIEVQRNQKRCYCGCDLEKNHRIEKQEAKEGKEFDELLTVIDNDLDKLPRPVNISVNHRTQDQEQPKRKKQRFFRRVFHRF